MQSIVFLPLSLSPLYCAHVLVLVSHNRCCRIGVACQQCQEGAAGGRSGLARGKLFGGWVISPFSGAGTPRQETPSACLVANVMRMQRRGWFEWWQQTIAGTCVRAVRVCLFLFTRLTFTRAARENKNTASPPTKSRTRHPPGLCRLVRLLTSAKKKT